VRLSGLLPDTSAIPPTGSNWMISGRRRAALTRDGRKLFYTAIAADRKPMGSFILRT